MIGLAVLSPRVAHAEEKTANAAIAQRLFDEAIKLIDRGRYAEACPKLARSQELAPSGGTLLNLGDCYEKNGQTASAWVSFRDAAARAGVAGMKQAQAAALLRSDALAPKLVYLKIQLAPDATEIGGLEVKRDGVAVSHAELGTEVPVDPGVHRIEASAPKYQSWNTEVSLATGDTPRAVTVSNLVKLPEVAQPPANDPGRDQQRIGLVLGAGGVVLTGVAGIFGLNAFSTNDEALTHCADGTHCDDKGLSLTDTAQTQATVSTALFIGSAALLVAGAVLYFTAPGPKPSTLGSAFKGPTATPRNGFLVRW